MLDGGGVNHEVGKARRDDLRHLCDVAQLPAHPERVVGGQILGFEVLCSCAAHRFLDVRLADVHSSVGCNVLCVVAQQREHQRAPTAHIQHVHPLFRHMGGGEVLDIVHNVQIGEKAISELHIKIPHLVGGAENLFPVHAILDAVDDFFIHAIFLSYQGISGTLSTLSTSTPGGGDSQHRSSPWAV